VQSLTEPILKPPPALFGRRSAPPQSKAGDELLLDELRPLTDEFYIYEAAVVGCLHLLTYELARGHLRNRIKPETDTAGTDEFFRSRVSVYLQCVLIAKRADPGLVHDGEAEAARQLLRIVHLGQRREFPSVVKLLAALTDSNCEELLPFDFIAEVLRRARYGDKLEAKLARLRRSQGWWEAYRLVDGLRDLSARRELPRSIRLWLPTLLERYPMWASWRPNLARLQTWDARLSPEQKARLGPVLELEGPDTTPQQRGTLRFSDEGVFVGSRAHGQRQGKDILDHLLDLLDKAVAIGSHATNLFIQLFCFTTTTNPPPVLRWHTLIQAEAGLEPRRDAVAKALCQFVRVLEPSPPARLRDRMLAITAALPLLQASPRLQDTYGETCNISLRGPAALSDAQRHFCALLQRDEPAESFGLEVRALGRALHRARWLHERWKPAYLAMLAALPRVDELRARFRVIRNADDPTRRAQMDYLAATLGSSDVAGGSGGGLTSAPPVVIEHRVWRVPLDTDRAALRRALRSVRAADLPLATACLVAAQREHVAFVREATTLLPADSDQACVNMARFLARRAAGGGGDGGLAQCWRALLLHRMRGRPLGLLERLGASLSTQSWNTWIASLRLVLGEKHIGRPAGLGFTAERIRQITHWKMGMERVHSQSTVSTVSSMERSD